MHSIGKARWMLWVCIVGILMTGLAIWCSVASGIPEASVLTRWQRIDGWIIAIEGNGQTTALQVQTKDGETWTPGIDFNATSVFRRGAVLSIAHVKPGQHVRVLVEISPSRTLAKSIEIVARDPALEEPRGIPVSPQVNYTFGAPDNASPKKLEEPAATFPFAFRWQ